VKDFCRLGLIIPTLIIALSACHERDGSAEKIAKAKQAVRELMNDPDAAQFRRERVVSDTIGDWKSEVVCGQVNGKNLFNAYIGFREFNYDPENGSVNISPGENDRTAACYDFGADKDRI